MQWRLGTDAASQPQVMALPVSSVAFQDTKQLADQCGERVWKINSGVEPSFSVKVQWKFAGYNSYIWGNVFMVNVSVKNIASKVGGGKGMCVKWEEGSPTSFVMMASTIIKTLHQNTAKTSLRFKTIKLFPGNRPPRSPYFIIYPAATPLPHQLLLYGCRIQPKGQAREY